MRRGGRQSPRPRCWLPVLAPRRARGVARMRSRLETPILLNSQPRWIYDAAFLAFRGAYPLSSPLRSHAAGKTWKGPCGEGVASATGQAAQCTCYNDRNRLECTSVHFAHVGGAAGSLPRAATAFLKTRDGKRTGNWNFSGRESNSVRVSPPRVAARRIFPSPRTACSPQQLPAPAHGLPTRADSALRVSHPDRPLRDRKRPVRCRRRRRGARSAAGRPWTRRGGWIW